jgi:DNA replication protein DnaC
MSQLNALKHLTFDNFETQGRMGIAESQAQSLEFAFNQSKHYAESMEGWLLITGDFGTGKTHLAAAIANQAVELGLPSIFITVPDLLDSLRFTFSDQNENFETRFEEIRKSPLLVLDDFGTENATDWAQEKLFQIINYRYSNQLPLVVTSNLSLTQLDGRLNSRLSDPELVSKIHIQAPDYRRPVTESNQNELSALHYLSDKTFLNFELREKAGLPEADSKSLKTGFDAARAYAEKPQGWIVFTGPHGSGKTHLAAAIANFTLDMEKSPLFIMVPDLLDHLRATFDPSTQVSYDRRFEDIRNSELLVLDDLGAHSSTAWAKEKLYQILNHRYNAKLATVITVSGQLDNLDERIQSRILDTRFCTIYGNSVPAFTGK